MKSTFNLGVASVLLLALAGCDKEEFKKKAFQAYQEYYKAVLLAMRDQKQIPNEQIMDQVAKKHGFLNWEEFTARALDGLDAGAWMEAVQSAARRFTEERKKILILRAQEEERKARPFEGRMDQRKAYEVWVDFYLIDLRSSGGVLEAREEAARANGFASWDEFVRRARNDLTSEAWVALTAKAHEWYRAEKEHHGGGGGALEKMFREAFIEFYTECLQAVREQREHDHEETQNRIARNRGFAEWSDFCNHAARSLGPDRFQQIIKETTNWYTQEVEKVAREAAAGGGEANAPADPEPVPGSNLDPAFRPGARMGDATAGEYYRIAQVMGEWIRGDLVRKTEEGEERLAEDEWVHVPSKGWKWAKYPWK